MHLNSNSWVNIPAIIALLPLFLEKAMVKHGMSLAQAITAYLNPVKISVLACDQPIFTQCKYIQWKWPGIYGENKMIIMLGGLHVEKALWYSAGDLPAFSGWTEALPEADVATSGAAESFLKLSHITRTRHAHQVTALALSKLQQDVFALSDNKDFEAWRLKMIKDNPTFHYWDLILKTEVKCLSSFECIEREIFHFILNHSNHWCTFFFALDHYNYSRWASIHLRDMKSLPDCAKETFCQN